MSAKTLLPVAPDRWLLLQWRRDNSVAATASESRQLIDTIRHGCQRGRYWLRAYAALPHRFALLLYPLEKPTQLIAELETVVGYSLEKLRPMRDDADLDRAARYVEAMPVRSRLSQRAEDYPWSNVGWIGGFGAANAELFRPSR